MSVFLRKWKKHDSTGNEMGDFLAEQMQKCTQIDILTGYFFFDGIQEIQKALSKNENLTLRILVGMDAGIDTRGLVSRVYERERNTSSANVSGEYLKKLDLFFAKFPAEQITQEQKLLADQFAKMIDDGRLKIRQTRISNHSKLYIFYEKDAPVSLCAGSSNFTYSGLSGRQEFNIHIEGDCDKILQTAKEFDEIWDKFSDPIVEFSNDNEDYIKIIKKVKEDSPTSTVTPFDAYMKIMHEYLKKHEAPLEIKQRIREILANSFFTDKDGEKQQYQELTYQVDAVSDAAKILQICGGVIIADVVGLGKSVIASLLAKLSCKPGIFLVPAHLIPNWEKYIADFKLNNWSVSSINDPSSLESAEFKKSEMVIIDEAHNLRNPKVQIYQSLQSALVERDVVLLTATPFNNRPEDLRSLIDLIGKFDKTKLKNDFDILIKKYNDFINEIKNIYQNKLILIPPEKQAEFDQITADIRQLVQPFIIRRNRMDLLAADSPYRAALEKLIPNQQPPVNREFELTSKQADFYDKILNEYFAGNNKQFKGAMYQPQVYVSGDKNKQDGSQSQSNLYGMICRFMVERWESSPVAFLKTLETLQSALQQYIERFEKHGIFVQIYDRTKPFEENSDDESGLDENDNASEAIEKLLDKIKDAKNRKDIYFRKDKCTLDLSAFGAVEMKSEVAEHFAADLQSDLETLQKIKTELNSCGVLQPGNDGKLSELKSELKAILAGDYEKDGDVIKPANPRKVIVFSGFADTAIYIRENLEKDHAFTGKVVFVQGKDCRNKDERKQKYEEIEAHFKANGAKAASNEKMILVCTDVLSEGVNLNQAGVVINYDLCYNPVRVIQRIGRINRIDRKVFENIYNINFFPSEKDINDMGEIAVRKMHTIHAIIREDAQVLSIDEKPLAVSDKQSDKDHLKEALEYAAPLSELSIIRKMYQDGLETYSSDLTKQTEYRKKLDLLAGRFSMLPGDCEALYLFYHSGFSVKAVKLPNVENHKIPQSVIPLVEALKELDPASDTAKLEFELSENKPHYKALTLVKEGVWAVADPQAMDKAVTKCKKLGITANTILQSIKLYVQTGDNKKKLNQWLKEKNREAIEDAVKEFAENHKITKIKDELFFTIGITSKGDNK